MLPSILTSLPLAHFARVILRATQRSALGFLLLHIPAVTRGTEGPVDDPWLSERMRPQTRTAAAALHLRHHRVKLSAVAGIMWGN